MIVRLVVRTLASRMQLEEHQTKNVRPPFSTFGEDLSCLDAKGLSVSIENSPFGDAHPAIWTNEKQSESLCSDAEPQFGFEDNLLTQFKKVALKYEKHLTDNIVKECEGLIAVFVAMKDVQNIEQFLAILFLYIRSHLDQAVSASVCEYIREIFKEEITQQSGNETPAWLELMRDLQANWMLMKSNKMFKHVSKLMGVLVSVGLCTASDLEFSIAGYKLFDEKVLSEHMSAFDMIDAVFGTVTYFAEGAYLCFKQGSIRPLLMDDHAALELDDEYNRIIQWWDLVQNGNLEKQLGVTDHEFDQRLEKLITALRAMTSSLKGFEKKLVNDKITKLLLIKNNYTSLKLSSGTREAPFCIELFGDSSQGKTTFGDTLITALLLAQNLPTGLEYRATIDPSSKYMDTWTTDKLVGILDDVMNDKAEFVDVSPTRFIINTCNNQQYVVNKADLSGKGKVFFEALLMLLTTNKKNLDAKLYSNCPYSVQRRAHVVITVTCKPEFQMYSDNGIPLGVDSEKVDALYTDENGVYTPPPFDDIWTLTVERAIKPQKLTEVATYEAFEFEGKKLINVDTKTVLKFLIKKFAAHRKVQKAIVERSKTQAVRMERCEKCCSVKGVCDCEVPELVKRSDLEKEEDIEPHFGMDLAGAVSKSAGLISESVKETTSIFAGRLENVATAAVLAYTTSFLRWWDWMAVVPTPWLSDKYFLNFMFWWHQDTLYKRVRSQTMWHIFYLVASFIVFHPFVFLIIFFIVTIRQCFVITIVKRQLGRELEKRTNVLPAIVRQVKDRYWQEFGIICASLVSLIGLIQVIRCLRKVGAKQGALEPKTETEVEARASATNVWKQFQPMDLPVSLKSKCVSFSQLKGIVCKNLRYFSLTRDDGAVMMSNAFFITSNAVLVPNHYFNHAKEFDIRSVYDRPNQAGHTFRGRISMSQSVLIPKSDFRLCYCATGGSFKNVVDFFPTGKRENVKDHPFEMLYRRKCGELVEMKGSAQMGRQSNSVESFYGGYCDNLSHNTFEGLCGAPIIANVGSPFISGFHLGGKTGHPVAVFGTLTREDLNTALEDLRKYEGVLITGQSGQFREEVLGVKILTGEPLHRKSPLNYIPDDHESQLQYFGSCVGQVSYKSDVKQTKMSEHVESVIGVKNVWGPPKMNPEWFGWQKCLSNISRPALSFPIDLVQRAILDYKVPILAFIQKHDFWKKLTPLTDEEALCGVPGRKFMDAIKLSTSIGFPLGGPKRNHVIELEPTEDGSVRREYTPQIQEEIDYARECYKRGERVNSIAKSCKKDEVLPLYDEEGNEKQKCRIFYSNPIVLTHMIRVYFLPIVYFIQMNPILTEQAVGVNAHGPEWDELDNFMLKFGKERIFAGDYSKYDQRMPSQMIIAALRVMIDIAKLMDYTEEDIRVMETMAGDIVYAYIAYNGDLIGLTEGTHISGNSLTVLVNGIVGSLNLRVAYFSMYPNCKNFRDHVAMMCYGDDNRGTVSEHRTNFNIKSYSEFLKPYGQSYTMPDKTSELQAWCEDADFLCRSSHYCPRLGKKVGALKEDSIFKSLHNYRRPRNSPLSDDQACAQNIDSAMTEWFLHGEEVYEKRRTQMIQVAKLTGVDHITIGIHMDYSERVADWHAKYTQ